MNLSKIKSSINESHPYLRNFFKVSAGVFVLGFIFFSYTYLIPDTEIVKAEGQKQSQSSNGPVLEVHIANNGMVYLQNARVESVSGTTIVVSTSWHSIELKWIVETNHSTYGKRHFGTSFLDSKGKQVDMKYIRTGDFITVTGLLDANSKEPTIKADTVRI